MEERSWTQAELAERAGFTRKHVNDLVKGRASITADTALRLEAIFGAPADFWLRREALYREALERKRRYDALRNDASWLKELPLSQMVKLGCTQRRLASLTLGWQRLIAKKSAWHFGSDHSSKPWPTGCRW